MRMLLTYGTLRYASCMLQMIGDMHPLLSTCFKNLVIWCFDPPRKCTTSTGVTVIGSAVSIFPVYTAWRYILKP
ncbi:hypothetical protein BDV39DRAFT_185554 [Aspergillus sergii]|uniref:Uncharacterized protein n=1 Tax=Aspergillus sergii TaxID=1034303 RepID=A0A5N6WP23_9EURO|nr:hypothetical protein BDV39DRAFT_185554 [Aspergillus sergii]